MDNNWSRDDIYRTYNLQNWGEGYFDVDENGNLAVVPDKGSHQIKIKDIVKEMRAQGIKLPAVIRFHDILRHQVKTLNRSFRKIIEDANYQGRYFGVYPVKVNQMREVVEEILDAGQAYDYGLEAGSKPELMAVLAYNTNKNAMTILNGYKDEDYLRLALLGNKLGRKVIVVIEKFSELSRLIKLSKEMNVRPMIGLRSRMAVEGHGRWKSSSGEKAKFGLSISEIIQAVQFCEEQGMKDTIKLFHFHVGSQISDIRTLKDAITEGGRIYAKLHKMGVNLQYFDAGGGLGIDYDGSRSDKDSSMNYTIDEYATDIVWGLKQICDIEGVPHPNIVTESGRMVTAHHSCVITNVIDQVNSCQTSFNTNKVTGENIIVENMRDLEDNMSLQNYQQYFNEAQQLKEDALNAFKLGILSLEERAKIETLYWKIMVRIRNIIKDVEFIPEGLQTLEDDLAPQYLCNFSVFQSIADYWAIDQLLPVMPITRLNEAPNLNCSIADITCDSDGKMDRFIDREHGVRSSIPLHTLKENEEYLLGIFLTGAYQDVMGDMHNLFGRLNEVHVFADSEDPSGFYIEEIIRGNNASSVLATMQYNPEYMAQKMKQLVNQEVVRGIIPPREGVRLVDFYEECLSNYTYLMTSHGE
ncbi:MAG: biosynthetic arginine decarboxylase [Bdellovibrio sp.]